MEENKQVRLSLSLFFLLIAIIAIGVMGFFIVKLNGEKTQEAQKVVELNGLLEEAKLETEKLKQNQKNELIKESLIDNSKKESTNKYQEFSANYLTNYKKLYSYDASLEAYSKSEISLGYGDSELDFYGVFLDDKNNAYLSFSRNKEEKIQSDVAAVYMYERGNGGMKDVIFQKLDGTICIISGENIYNQKYIVEKKENLKDIINVIPYSAHDFYEGEGVGGAMDYAFVDINGNIYTNI